MSVGDTEIKRMSRLRNTIEQCLTSFKHAVRSHNKLQQVVQLEAPSGHGQFLYAVCSSILKSSRLQKDNTDSVRKGLLWSHDSKFVSRHQFTQQNHSACCHMPLAASEWRSYKVVSRARMWPMK